MTDAAMRSRSMKSSGLPTKLKEHRLKLGMSMSSHGQRRCAAAGMGGQVKCYTFRATGITAYLLKAAPSKGPQAIAAMKARARPSFTTGQRTGSRWRRSSGSRSNALDDEPLWPAQDALALDRAFAGLFFVLRTVED